MSPRTKSKSPDTIPDGKEFERVAEDLRQSLGDGGNFAGKSNDPNFVQKAGMALNSLMTEKYEKYLNKIRDNALTVLLVGDTGLGKSSLTNIVFCKDLAKSGHGEPFIQNFTCYGPTLKSPVRIIDSKGVEKLAVKSHNKELKSHIRQSAAYLDVLKHVHLIYYFAGLTRWQKADKQYVEELQKSCRVIVIINQRDIRKSEQVECLRKVIKKDLPDIDIAECGDPRGTNNWIPKTCKNKHGQEYVQPSMRKETWSCEFVVGHTAELDEIFCNDNGGDQPFGHKELSRMSIDKLPKVVQASFKLLF